MARLVIVSNRVAVPDEAARAGGLAVALQEALQQDGGIWFGWSGNIAESEEPPAAPEIIRRGPVTFALLHLNQQDHDEYYTGYANRTLWPVFHYRTDLADFTSEFHSGYARVNALFADKLAPLVAPDDDVWVHDYHLIPLGAELRRRGLRNRMGFFLHTPFPALDILMVLPHHREIVEALCAYDLVGFQTADDLRAFHDYVTVEGGGEVLSDGSVRAFGRSLRADVFPIGIDVEGMVAAAQAAPGRPETRRLQRSIGDGAVVVGVDRLDYSKGLVERLQAFGHLLEIRPDYQGRVTLMQIAPPSRSDVPEYMAIRRELETEAGHINGRFADFDWTPIRYINRSYPREVLAAFYRSSQVGLVTPLRDGMNLVAKEYVAAQNPDDPGVLVLSRFAGAARELDTAIQVNPHDMDGMAQAIVQALEMPLEERRERWRAMMAAVRRHSLDNWRTSFLRALRTTPTSQDQGA